MILLSACLAGFNVRYDGGNARNDLAAQLVALGQAVTICPEVMGGMRTPREPAEIQDGNGGDVIVGRARVVNRRGVDVTKQYLQGAQLALGIAQRYHVQAAFLKQKSPACGTQLIYDGHFSGHKIAGIGVAAALLRQHGIQVFGDEELSRERVRPWVDSAVWPLLLENGR
ncbi:DUF523 domain-containing protein [Limosilactobacillus kribbianus]|uniref:DUF523 domain-containing protein n=1 Tax=Limosilactobacillus kribbianus TaxID=2982695 RepID=UPI0022641120|nr:DUF523 domain-containing protein [Limosilactobacillus kribbianus]